MLTTHNTFVTQASQIPRRHAEPAGRPRASVSFAATPDIYLKYACNIEHSTHHAPVPHAVPHRIWCKALKLLLTHHDTMHLYMRAYVHATVGTHLFWRSANALRRGASSHGFPNKEIESHCASAPRAQASAKAVTPASPILFSLRLSHCVWDMWHIKRNCQA